MRKTLYTGQLKPALDRVLAVIALIVLSPLLLCVAVLIRVKLGSPVLFRQYRPGKNAKLFRICKFRSMTDERDETGRLLPAAKRLNRFGRLLRASSLDELPNLWSIARGEMSFVGPRPLLPEHLPLYTERQARRHEVRPGITGWAQINGRNVIEWEQKLEFDLEYVNQMSFRMDLLILMRTVDIVLRRKGMKADADCSILPFTATVRAVENTQAA
jgi:lipopolysaccharide/colanic/teichoic acid biosynthesis glycosyltransferase